MSTARVPGLVSVVMPVYRGERFVGSAIESVLAQTLQAFELIIVNDGSPDASAAEIARYLPHPRIRYIEQRNAGVACARNAGLELARGAFVALLDQDDTWLPRKLEIQMAYLDAHPEVAFVHSRIECMDAAGNDCSCEGALWVFPFEGACAGRLLLGNGIAPLTVVVRRQCVDDVGVFDQALAPADDWDLWLRLADRYPVGFIDEVTARYRVHDHNASKDHLTMQRAVLRIMDAAPARLPNAMRDVSDSDLAVARSLALRRAAEACEIAGKQREARDYWKEAYKVNGEPEALLALIGIAASQRSRAERLIASHPRMGRLARWYSFKVSRLYSGMAARRPPRA